MFVCYPRLVLIEGVTITPALDVGQNQIKETPSYHPLKEGVNKKTNRRDLECIILFLYEHFVKEQIFG